jgi:2-succinyl-6-hydroxy-2,4-cyclohexadiene-1-carboxylate synthase
MTTLTFFHGFMGCAADWDPVRAALPGSETRAIEISPAASWTAGIRDLCAQLPERGVLVGYSMGARLALACALAVPARCSGLVFVSGSPGLPRSQRAARRQADEQWAQRLEAEDRRQFLSAWYQQPVFSSLPRAARQEEINRRLSRDGSHWPALLRTYSVSRQPDFWPQLAQLPVPILAVAGAEDTKYVQIVQRLRAACPASQVAIVPAAGHIVHRQQPEQLASLIKEFVRTQLPARDPYRRPGGLTTR